MARKGRVESDERGQCGTSRRQESVRGIRGRRRPGCETININTQTQRHRASLWSSFVSVWLRQSSTMTISTMILAAAILGAQTGKETPDLTGFWNNQYTPNLTQALGHEPPF